MGIVPVGVILSGNFPRGSYPRWELSGWELSWVGIFRMGVVLGGNSLWWDFSGGNFPAEIIRMGVFMLSYRVHTLTEKETPLILIFL